VAANNVLKDAVERFNLPLFLDTVFSAAMTFTAGPAAGVVTAVLTSVAATVVVKAHWAGMFFIPCSVTEVLLLWAFWKSALRDKTDILEEKSLRFIVTGARLFVTAVTLCFAVSLLGGLIDSVVTVALGASKDWWHSVNYKQEIMRHRIPDILAAVLARLPINLADRFIVVCGGYGISLLMNRFLRTPPDRPGT
jgi:hypothetical protein